MSGRDAKLDVVVSGAAATRAGDFYRWTNEQAGRLRSGDLRELDHAGLADEVEDLGRSEYSALASDLAIILQHMLTWDHQWERRSRSWELSIRDHRRRVARRLKASPSLAARLDEAIIDAYLDGRDRDERIPAQCPYSASQIFEAPFVCAGQE